MDVIFFDLLSALFCMIFQIVDTSLVLPNIFKIIRNKLSEKCQLTLQWDMISPVD